MLCEKANNDTREFQVLISTKNKSIRFDWKKDARFISTDTNFNNSLIIFNHNFTSFTFHDWNLPLKLNIIIHPRSRGFNIIRDSLSY